MQAGKQSKADRLKGISKRNYKVYHESWSDRAFFASREHFMYGSRWQRSLVCWINGMRCRSRSVLWCTRECQQERPQKWASMQSFFLQTLWTSHPSPQFQSNHHSRGSVNVSKALIWLRLRNWWEMNLDHWIRGVRRVWDRISASIEADQPTIEGQTVQGRT